MKRFKVKQGGETRFFAEAENKKAVETFVNRETNIPVNYRVEEAEEGFEQNSVNKLAENFKRFGYSEEEAKTMAQGRDKKEPSGPSLPIVRIDSKGNARRYNIETSGREIKTKLNDSSGRIV